MAPKHRFQITRGAIAASYPDDLGRRAPQGGQILEIGILGDDGETTLPSTLPDFEVAGSTETELVHVPRVGKEVAQPLGQEWREIFVEQQFHAATATMLRSRSAA